MIKKKVIIIATFFIMIGMCFWYIVYRQLEKKNVITSQELVINESVINENLDIMITDNITMKFVLIKSGIFQMGAHEEIGDEDELPVREITITNPFYMGSYEVTQKQWEAVMGYNPSKFKGDNNPVDSVSYFECISFTQKLSEMTGLIITLPTEAMWEYACRAGTKSKWFYGDTENNASLYSWISPHDGNTTHEVGKKLSNPWGLYDVYGNVQEWCLDWYENPYSNNELVNPIGPTKGESKIVRGGGWGAFADNARSSYRNAVGPDIQSDGIGLRCVIIID